MQGLTFLRVLESMDVVSEFRGCSAGSRKCSDTPSGEDRKVALGLRDEITFTIDGADAKDLDDTIHIKHLKNGNFELGVHIADVSYCVRKALLLIRKPMVVATSVYVGRPGIYQCFPERLSSGICSLNPQVSQLGSVCYYGEIDKHGRVRNYTITQTVIKRQATV